MPGVADQGQNDKPTVQPHLADPGNGRRSRALPWRWMGTDRLV